jgi:hypothetical protein
MKAYSKSHPVRAPRREPFFLSLFCCGIAAVFLNACAPHVIARNNGARINLPEGTVVPGGVEWSGGKDENGLATGKGVETWYGADGKKISETNVEYVAGTKDGPFVMRHFDGGKLSDEIRGSYSKGVPVGEQSTRWFLASKGTDSVNMTCSWNAYGQLHGKYESRTLNGERSVSYWHNGSQTSSTDYNSDGTVKAPAASSYVASSSGSDDSDLLGALFAIGGAAAGSSDLTMAGISMVAGDDVGAMNHVRNFAGTGGSTATSGAGLGAAKRKPAANKGNLIDHPSYALGKYRGAGGDHIKHYIDSADDAYRMYKQTGDESYYTRHREYADIAKQFHKETATKGTRTIR